MKSYQEFITEAKKVNKMTVGNALDSAKIEYTSIKEPSRGEIEVVSGIKKKSGLEWDKYEDSVYKALKSAGISLEGDASVFIQ